MLTLGSVSVFEAQLKPGVKASVFIWYWQELKSPAPLGPGGPLAPAGPADPWLPLRPGGPMGPAILLTLLT